MADETNRALVHLLSDQPVSPGDRELAQRNRRHGLPRQEVQATDDRLARLLAGSPAGGGIGSDAGMPGAQVQRDPAMEKKIQQRAMAGLPPTPEMDAYLRAIASEKEARGMRTAPGADNHYEGISHG